MADVRFGGSGRCDDRCGCPSPCPGDVSCKCGSGRGDTRLSGGGDDHMRCTCGEHCGCNPCTCQRSEVMSGTGKAFCKCGDGCTCLTCSS